AVARDAKVTCSPSRFGCALETSTAGGSGPRRTAREGLRCGTAATRLGFDPEWSSRKRDQQRLGTKRNCGTRCHRPTLLRTGPAAKAQAVLVSGAASDTCQASGAHFA